MKLSKDQFSRAVTPRSADAEAKILAFRLGAPGALAGNGLRVRRGGRLCAGKYPQVMKTCCRIARVALLLAAPLLIWLSADAQPFYYVNAAATAGARNGSDWANAYLDFPANLVRGATYYVAAGTYGNETFSDATSGTTLITIKKAIGTDHGTSTGWQDSYTNQAVFGVWQVLNSYYVFDGNVRNSDWRSGYGFKINNNNVTFWAVHVGTGPGSPGFQNITFRNIEVQGWGPIGYQPTLSYSTPSGFYIFDCSNITIQKVYAHDNADFTIGGNNNVLIEYSVIARNESDPNNHSEGLSGGGGDSNITIRYSVWEDVGGTACITALTHVVGATEANWAIYGNVFAYTGNVNIGLGGDGAICCINAERAVNWQVYNNTFANLVSPAGFTGVEVGVNGAACQNVLVYNNFWFNCSGATVGAGPGGASGGSSLSGCSGCASDYNRFDGTPSLDSEAHIETHATANTSIFVNNSAGEDFRLTADTQPGLALPSPYNTDMDGNSRGSDGVWSRGAFQFTGGASTTNPVIFVSPPNLSFGAVPPVTTVTNSFTVQNVGGGSSILAGTATLGTPANGFTIVSGGTYLGLAAGQSQTVLVSYMPTGSTNGDSQTVTFTGGGGTTATVSGQLASSRPTPPVISGVGASSIGSNSALVSWTTDQNASSVVQYGLTTSYGLGVTNTSLVQSHQINLTQLTPGTTYHYIVQSSNQSGLTSVSGDFTFQTSQTGVSSGSGLAGKWAFDMIVGTLAIDSSGNGDNATLMNGITQVAGVSGHQAVQLNGTNSYLRVADAPPLRLINAVSISAWVQLAAAGGWQTIVEKLVAEGTNAYPFCDYGLVAVDAGGGSGFDAEVSVTTMDGNFNYVVSSSIVSYGAWHQLVGVYDGASLSIYVDGALAGTQAVTGSLLSSDQALYMGRNGAGGDSLNGVIDDVCVYDRALPASQVQSLYNSQPPSPPTGLHTNSPSVSAMSVLRTAAK